jgi:hypothetical protein
MEYLTEIWDILSPFGEVCVHLVIFFYFGITYPEKSGNPAGFSPHPG